VRKGDYMTQDELKATLKEKRERLFVQQQMIKEKKLPVLVLVEGWGASGKGTLISYLIRDLDPRFYQVVSMKEPTEEERRYPFLWRHIQHIPEQGKFVFMDCGWMADTVRDKLLKKIDDKEYEERIRDINVFERQLTDNGYMVLKLFIDSPGKEQKKRIEKLLDSKNTRWRVSEDDFYQVEHHKKCKKAFDKYIEDTDTKNAPWHIIKNNTELKEVELEVCTLLTDAIDKKIIEKHMDSTVLAKKFPMYPTPLLSEVSLDGKSMTKEEYEVELKKAQKKLKELHNKIYRYRIPVIIAYEGWDAAGKGGNIKRMTSAMDARGFEVHPIASPEPHELHRHYLWRFWNRLPKDGHVAIFDRTWYGRVMVERLEGFCSEDDWKRAYNEMNEFEYGLNEWGAIIVKFWVQIDKDTQLERFTLRQNTPEKQWKITDEDWRNRDKWDEYEVAVNDMIQKTSTEYAPWHIIESNDKYYARIKAINTVIDAIEGRLAKIK
jgi:polyphosphate:AMP phosphotransferase